MPENEANKTLIVTCKTAESLPVEQIQAFQGEFKNLSKRDFQKLKASLIKYGLSFPSYIWKQNGNAQCIDGHQRARVLLEMQKEGWKIPPVPVVYVDAKDEKEAKEKILLLSSQYGHYTMDSLYEFLETSKLDFVGELKDVLDLPQVRMKDFEKHYYQDNKPEEPREKALVVCPKCGESFVAS